MPTISIYVDVYLNDFDTDELIEELKSRGLHVSNEPIPETEVPDKYEIDYLINLVDKNEKRDYNYYRVRNKLNNLC